MLTTNCISPDFTSALAEKILNDQDVLARFLEENIVVNFHSCLREAFEALDITTIERAFMLGVNNPVKVDPRDSFFKVEDGVIVSSNSLLDLYPVNDIETQLFTILIDGRYGHNNWIVKKYCKHYPIYVRRGEKGEELYGDIYLLDRELRPETLKFIKKLFLIHETDQLEPLLEDLQMTFMVNMKCIEHINADINAEI